MVKKLKLMSLFQELSGRDLPIAVTEFQGYYPEGKQKAFNYYLRSWGNAFFCGDLIREMLVPSNHVVMAHYFIVTGLQLKADGDAATFLRGADTTWKRLPAFFVSRLWNQHTGAQLLAAAVEAPRMQIKGFGLVKAAERAVLSTLASRRADGKTICLMVFNRDMEHDLPVTIRVKGAAVAWAKCWQVTAPSLTDANPNNANLRTNRGESDRRRT